MNSRTKLASSSFLAKEHKFDSLVKTLDTLGIGLSVINREMRIVWVNQVLIDVFGPPEKIYGQHCYKLYNHRKKVCSNCPTVKAFRSGKSGFKSIQRSFDRNGKRIYYQLTTTPITNNGKVVEVLELCQNVTKDVIAEREKKRFQVSRASEEIKRLNKNLKEEVKSKTSKLDTAIKELNTVYTVSHEIVSSLDLQEIFPLIAKMVCSIINTKACVLRMLDKDKKWMSIVSSHGVSAKYIDNTPLKTGEGLSGIITKTGQPIVCPQVSKEESIKYSYYITREGYQSAVGVPIIFNDEVLGSIITYDEALRNYTKTEVMLLSTFASQVAVAIKNAQLHEKVHLNYLDTINALALAVEARDPYTHGHSRRVTAYAIEIAHSLGLSRKQLQAIQSSGSLHDVGKIAIPDTILRKPAALTEEERLIIQQHPLKGVNMLAPLKFLESGFPLIKHHHEKFDGSGYPQGLKKTDIPLIARIFACADAFDAMTSDRPYRAKLTLKKAVEELKENAGSQFDPYVVKRFMSILKSK